jgi:hypothetical protein
MGSWWRKASPAFFTPREKCAERAVRRPPDRGWPRSIRPGIFRSANAPIVLKDNRRSEFNFVKSLRMKRSIALTVVAALSQAIAAFAGPPEPKQVVAPPPPPPEYFRPNEFDIGAFATWVDFPNTRGGGSGSVHGWGGGMDFTYWFPWKYAGVRFQGTGMSIQVCRRSVPGYGNEYPVK